MSSFNWEKDAARRRMQRQGTEDKADVLSKEALRRQANALLAQYRGPVTKAPAGIRVTRSQVSKNRPGRAHQPDFFRPRPEKVRSADNCAVPPGLVIYCDGACEPNPGAGGWGFVVYRDGTEIHSQSGGAEQTTNNVMELTGALMALQWITENASGDQARLFCDSMYVVNGCNDWRHGWKKKGWRRGVAKELANADLWRSLDEVLNRVPITLEWCKGHAGIIGNERADELSLMGREDALALTPDPLQPIRDQLDYSARGGA